ncbi:MAG: hypothetical protein ACRC6X_07225 [Culicoidibacterales bacterium]
MNALWYFACAVTVLFVIKLALTIFGFGADNDFTVDDFNADVHTAEDISSDTSFVLLSVDSVLSFFMVFSWSTLMFIKQFTFSIVLSVLFGFVCGSIMMLVYSFLMSKVKKLETPVVKDLYPSVGAQGTMYLSTQNGKGKAKFSVEGKYIIYDVLAADGPLETGTLVEVSDVTQQSITVTQVN